MLIQNISGDLQLLLGHSCGQGWFSALSPALPTRQTLAPPETSPSPISDYHSKKPFPDIPRDTVS